MLRLLSTLGMRREKINAKQRSPNVVPNNVKAIRRVQFDFFELLPRQLWLILFPAKLFRSVLFNDKDG